MTAPASMPSRFWLAGAFLVACAGETPDMPGETADTSTSPTTAFAPYAEDGESVASLIPDRYLGTWYEIATTPSFQQQSCTGTTADYSLRDDGTVRVLNRCTVSGSLNEIEGSARFLDDTYARLEVDFGLGFSAPYYVVELDGGDGGEPYEFAAVSSAGLALWVLARRPTIDETLYETLLERLSDAGLPSDTLVPTPHPAR